jgi:nucleoside-diphosphate-sugar epimerase
LTALVTGGTGFIGSHLVDYLLLKNYRVTCIVRESSNLRWLNNKPVEIFKFSFDDYSQLEKIISEADYIFHVAGLINAVTFDEFYQVNSLGTKYLIDAVNKYQKKLKRFVFVSSQTVGGPSFSLENPINEESPAIPITNYGKSKKIAEEFVLKYINNFPITIIRSPAVFGPRDSAMVPIFRFAKFGIGILIGFEKSYINLIYGEDLAQGIIEAAESEKTIGQTYYVGWSQPTTWSIMMDEFKLAMKKNFILKIKFPIFFVLGAGYLTELVGKLISKPQMFDYEKAVDFTQKYWIFSTEKAERDFNFKTKFDLRQAVQKTVDWYKKENWL